MTDRLFLGNTSDIIIGSITRPNDAAPYAAGDVIGSATGPGPTTHVIDFSAIVKAAGGSGLVSTALLIDSANQATPPQLELWIFTAAPAAQADNTAFAVSDLEIASLVGIVPLTTARVGNAGAAAAGNLAIQSDVASLVFKCAGGSQDLYGVLVVRNAYTPVAQEVFTLKVSVLQDIVQAA